MPFSSHCLGQEVAVGHQGPRLGRQATSSATRELHHIDCYFELVDPVGGRPKVFADSWCSLPRRGNRRLSIVEYLRV